ncbi:MAG: hypothetical protein DRI36_05480, partial [Caldiserica bacterium]
DFGYNIGMAFQIMDDILDIEEERFNYLKVYSKEKGIKDVRKFTELALSSIKVLGERGNLLKEFAIYLARREK